MTEILEMSNFLHGDAVAVAAVTKDDRAITIPRHFLRKQPS